MQPSSTSAHAVITFANRNRSSLHSRCTSCGASTWSGSGSSQCVTPRLNPSRTMLHIESDGIHDIVVAVASTRMTPTP
jgi:hypothetical protein